jgi:hypothetical protein
MTEYYQGPALYVGTELGHPLEPQYLFARVVGILHDERLTNRVIARMYQPGDRLGVPTGDYYRPLVTVRYTDGRAEGRRR